jgi:hypothetical protein
MPTLYSAPGLGHTLFSTYQSISINFADGVRMCPDALIRVVKNNFLDGYIGAQNAVRSITHSITGQDLSRSEEVVTNLTYL